MQFVIDSNEYIYAFGLLSELEKSSQLLDTLIDNIETYNIRIPRTIFEEVRRNLSPEAFREFNEFINNVTEIDEDFVVPFELGSKYEAKGFKSADAFIAAYTEWTGSDILVSENRHFLTQHSNLPFKVLTAEKCLKIIK
ncbi:type II toxin-antitoxin system VapC family toxin [Candidatus Desantisbacteria bacterium]|nr:type II toxin-antitoxin system VapC family toxin [Candidatus Desantisbacteria bacterium]